MGVTPPEKARNVLTAMINGVKYDFHGNFSSSIEWYNLEDVNRTLRNVIGRGIDKAELRTILNKLVARGLLEKRDPQDKTQSKAEYHITEGGKDLLVQWEKMNEKLLDINKKDI